MYIRIRCTKCRIRFDTVRELLDHVATHESGQVSVADAATVPARAAATRASRREASAPNPRRRPTERAAVL